jgi:hypothetical protein
LAAVVIVVSTGAMKPIEADKRSFSYVNKIIFLATQNPKSFIVSTAESRATVGMGQVIFGFAAGLVASTVAETAFERKVKVNLDGAALGEDLHEAIKERLIASGYAVETVTLRRQKPGELLSKYSDIKLPTDAYLDVSVEGGYTDRYTEGVAFCPMIDVDLRFVRKPNRIIYAQSYEYSCRKKALSTIVHVPVEEKYRFADRNAVGDNQELTREALWSGIAMLADRIAADLQKDAKLEQDK